MNHCILGGIMPNSRGRCRMIIRMLESGVSIDEALDSSTGLVYMMVPWSRHCQYMDNQLERISDQFPDLKVIIINNDDHRVFVERMGFVLVPTFGIWRNGWRSEVHLGSLPSDELATWLDAALEGARHRA